MLSKKEKIAYGLGDTASNIIFQTVMLFLTFFYTDIFGISPAVVGTLFLVVRVIDAVTDPIMGSVMFDRLTSLPICTIEICSTPPAAMMGTPSFRTRPAAMAIDCRPDEQ